MYSEQRKGVKGGAAPPAAILQPTQRACLGLPGVPPAKAPSSTTWKHVLTLKHMSNSSCNHMLKVKPHAQMFCWIGASFYKGSIAGGRWRLVVDPEFPGMGQTRCLAQGLGGTRWQVFPESVTLVWKTWLGSTGILCVAKRWLRCWFGAWPAKLLTNRW